MKPGLQPAMLTMDHGAEVWVDAGARGRPGQCHQIAVDKSCLDTVCSGSKTQIRCRDSVKNIFCGFLNCDTYKSFLVSSI